VARIATPVKTNLTVQTPPGFNFRSVIDSHGWVQLVPFGYDQAVPDTLRYTLGLRHDRAVTLSLQSRDGGVSAAVDCQLSEAERENVRSSVRQMLGLDIDLSEFYERIAGESRYAWVQGRGAGRLLAAPTAWEDLVKTLLTTNVSWTNTVSMVSRLVRYGTSASDGSFAFPTPAQLLTYDPDTLNADVRTGYRIKSLYQLAKDIVAGEIDVESWRDPSLDSADLYKQITALHGFGAYAAGSVLRLWGHFDYLGLDSVARSTFSEQFCEGGPTTDAEIIAHYAPYDRWRGLVLWMDVIRPDIPTHKN
jgi:3-methyladenine DNA glycosylase/8-oxoguanine DNA glycosylase